MVPDPPSDGGVVVAQSVVEGVELLGQAGVGQPGTFEEGIEQDVRLGHPASLWPTG